MYERVNVVLPKWIWEDAQDNDHFKRLVANYMKRYPGYKIKAIKNNIAICEVMR